MLTRPHSAGGSADPDLNATLATALRKAKVAGVPKDNIEKALARVCLYLEGVSYMLLIQARRPPEVRGKTRIRTLSMRLWCPETLAS